MALSLDQRLEDGERLPGLRLDPFAGKRGSKIEWLERQLLRLSVWHAALGGLFSGATPLARLPPLAGCRFDLGVEAVVAEGLILVAGIRGGEYRGRGIPRHGIPGTREYRGRTTVFWLQR